ncbi:hypothetical protein [Haliscomenobacter sp.]|uniref:hypothetical protein n=1 Tax=Haliscomenobacter sp. TaxID=2717303 RepID=UPI003BA8471C
MCHPASNLLFSLLLFFSSTGSGGVLFGQALDHPLYELEARLKKGDQYALFEVAHYFDSQAPISLFFCSNPWVTTEAYVAKKMVKESCQFKPEEFIITDSTTGRQFFDFLSLYHQQLLFFKMASCFMLQAPEKWEIRFDLRKISSLKKEEIEDRIEELLDLEWIKQSQVEALIARKDPKALLAITAELFTHRRDNDRFKSPEPYLQLVHWLTGMEIGVENEHGKMSWVDDYYFDDKSRFNLWVFFAKHYQQFEWNEQESKFINPQLLIRSLDKEEYLFQLLSNENDSLAMDAFIQLSSCSPQKVKLAASEYFDFSMVKNDFIPVFPCAFITKLAELTAYCRDHGIDYKGAALLQKKIALLGTELPVNEMVKLENDLIQGLNLEEITVLEYWALVYESRWQLGKSTKRILNEFYQKNWQQILAQPKHLDLYLKKANLLYQLTYQGFYNDYRGRFSPITAEESKALNNHSTQDIEVKAEIELLLGHKKH